MARGKRERSKRGCPKGARRNSVTGPDGVIWRTPIFVRKKWRVSKRHPGGRITWKTLRGCLNETEAKNRRNELAGRPDETERPPKKLHLRDALRKWIVGDTSLLDNRESTVQAYESFANIFCKALGARKLLSSIKREDISNLVTQGAWEARKPVTKLGRMTKARKFFTWAKQNKHIAENPMEEPFKFPDTWYATSPVLRTLKDDDCRKLLEKCASPWVIDCPTSFGGKTTRRPSKDLALVTLIALRSGLRESNIVGPMALRWGDIDFEKGTFTLDVDRLKNGRRLRIKGVLEITLPIHSELLAALRERIRNLDRAPDPQEPIVPGKTFNFGFRGSFDKAVKRAGLAPLRFHTLRAVFSTALVREGCSALALPRLMIHTKKSMTEHYIVDDIEVLRRELEKLPPLLSISEKNGIDNKMSPGKFTTHGA